MFSNRKAKQFQKVSQVVDNLINGLNLDISLDKTEFFENPKAGYSEIRAFVEQMIESGQSDIDILLSVGEKFDRDLSQRVLADLKLRGIF